MKTTADDAPANNSLAASVGVDANNPWFSGHFPDNPVLPGIAQLKYVFELLSSHWGEDMQLAGLKRVKFRKLIVPGDRLDIQVTPTGTENQYIFEITSESEDVCSGRMSFVLKSEIMNS